MLIASAEAITSPANTRDVVAPTVIITDSKAVGPSFIDWPTCQRVAVLKYLPCSAMLPRNMCGGGSSLGSAQPNAQQSSQRPANRPIERHVHQILDSVSRPAIDANRRVTAAGGGAPAGAPASPSRATTGIRQTCTLACRRDRDSPCRPLRAAYRRSH